MSTNFGLDSGSRQKEKILLRCRFAPRATVVGEHRLPQHRMTALLRPAIRIRRASQHHLDHEGKSLELRAYAQTRCDQIRLGDVSSSSRLERFRWPAQDLLNVIGRRSDRIRTTTNLLEVGTNMGDLEGRDSLCRSLCMCKK